ncbi:aldo/keto reductase [Paenibacillus wynnii]|uniref:aldo/keto reductase n=1 Tax=Paenibacillus wynnii TaxID=268407 RepID=UPI00278CD92B|nr:aldo/keto reductase [Paenibacillus wynnii]MDQ0192312.1 aryl-alcohol dehydrogenase-like predicted oxidoreductase [Paenibacillus wynnii]
MKFRKLGSTGIDVSVIGLGTWQFGGEWGKDFTQAEVDAMLDKAGELGINLLDTAECYGDHLSEKFIGSYLARRKREDWIVATKFGHHFTGHLEREQLWNADDVLKQLDDSLRALQSEYVDLYQFHSGTDNDFNNDKLWSMLDRQVQAGKIRHLGISISASNQGVYQTSSAPGVQAEVIQVVYNRLDRKPEEHIFPLCLEHHLGVLARVPLASGYLSGKYKPDAIFQPGDVRANHNEETRNKQLKEVGEIAANEVPRDIPMAQWALAWCLQNPAVTSVIPGCKNVEQVVSNAEAAKLDMVKADSR